MNRPGDRPPPQRRLHGERSDFPRVHFDYSTGTSRSPVKQRTLCPNESYVMHSFRLRSTQKVEAMEGLTDGACLSCG